MKKAALGSIASLFLSFFLVPALVHGQSLPGVSDPITLTSIPTSPGPHETVEIDLSTSAFDADAAFITWKENGSVIAQGTGDKSVTVETGNIGSALTVTVDAQVPNLGTFSSSLAVNPASVNLIWQGNTSIPPFYEGLSLVSWGASYTIEAFPEVYENGKRVDPSHLIYTWSKNYSVDESESGYGKNTYKSDGSISYVQGGDTISLTVATTDGAVSAQSSVTIPLVTPSLFIYEENPLYGVLYNKSLDEASLSDTSITLHAEPYNFSNITGAIGALVWTMNGSPIPSFAGKQSLTLLKQNNISGSADVEASIQSPSAILQGAEKTVTIDINGN